MKTIGLLGGISWQSTTTYYKIINNEVALRLGGLHSAKCIVYSVDFEEIERCQTAGEWDKAGAILHKGAQALQAAGAECVLICANTMHKVLPIVREGVDLPFLHIADCTADYLLAKGAQSAILLGTRYTMQQGFIREPLEQAGLAVFLPSEEEQAEINRIIFEELVVGVVKPAAKEYLLAVIHRLQGEGAGSVILGCTELGMLVRRSDCTIPVADTAEVHAKAAVDFALG